MRNEKAIMVRYIGEDNSRRFLLQRADTKFWSGDEWVDALKNAKVYYDHKTAQAVCAAIQHERHKGKPVRSFNLNMVVSLVADEVQNISMEALAKYIATAMRIDLETSIYGDGPTTDSFVAARLQTHTLEEVEPIRKKF